MPRQKPSTLKITRTQNGFLTHFDFGCAEEPIIATVHEEVATEDIKDPQISAAVSLLWYVVEVFGLIGSRHDAERIYITVGPGDKHESGGNA